MSILKNILSALTDIFLGIHRKMALRRLKERHPPAYEEVADVLRNDPEFLIQAAKVAPQYIEFASPSLANDMSFLKLVLEHVPDTYRFMQSSVRSDKNCTLIALRFTPKNLLYAAEELLADKSVILAAINAETCMNSLMKSSPSFDMASSNLKEDKEVLQAVQKQIEFKVRQGDFHTNR